MHSIRPFEDKDRQAVMALLAELQDYERQIDPNALPSETTTAPYFAELLGECQQKSGMIYVAESAENVVGFIALRVEQSDDILLSLDKYLYISDIVVQESQRGQHIGAALLAQAEAYARHMNCPVIHVHSLAGNAQALAAYHKFGFQDHYVLLSKAIVPPKTSDRGIAFD